MKTKWNMLVVFALLASLVGGIANPAQAAPGDLDPGFAPMGTGKIVMETEAPHDAWGGNVAAQQADGKLIVIGNTYGAVAVHRLNPDGSPDTTFGGGDGLVSINIGDGVFARSVALDGSGNILVAAQYIVYVENTSLYYAALVRLTANGVLDTSFGVDGVVKTDSLTLPSPYLFSEPVSVGILSTEAVDRIILVGSIVDPSDQVPRRGIVLSYNTIGQLDTTFDTDGMLIYGADTATDKYFVGMEVGTDILIVVNTVDREIGTPTSSILRYDATGAQTQEYTSVPSAGLEAVHEMADGTLYAAGMYIAMEGLDAALVRYDSTGQLDDSFGGGDGIVTTDLGWDMDWCHSLLVQTDSITMACSGAETTDILDPEGNPIIEPRFTLWRMGLDGSPVSGFGSDGVVKTAFNNLLPWLMGGSAQTLLATGTDTFLAVGNAEGNPPDGAQSRIALARYNNSTGALDETFGMTGGRLITDLNAFSTGGGGAGSTAVQSTGRIIVAGDSGNSYALHRFNADGTSDDTFAAATPVLPQSTNIYAAVVVDPNDNILVAVYGRNVQQSSTTYWWALVRHTADGALDGKFGGGDGVVTLTAEDITSPANTYFGPFYDIAVQSTGDIVLAGMFAPVNVSMNGYALLLKFGADGTRDTNFGSNGMVLWQRDTTDFLTSFLDIDIGAGDTILVAADSMNSGSVTGSVVRYTANGALDLEFADYAAGVFGVLQELADGTVLAAGYGYDETGTEQGLLVRYLPDGTFDPSFDTDGMILRSLAEGGSVFMAMLVQPDGKIVLGGEAKYVVGGTYYTDFNVLRLNPDGTDDDSFGVVTTVFDDLVEGVEEGCLRSLFLTPGGKILAAGFVKFVNYEQPNRVALAQYDPGNITPPYTVSGTVFNDKNGDGVWDLGTGTPDDELGVGDMRVVADIGCDGVLPPQEPFTLTDSDGGFSLSLPVHGHYCIVADPEAGWNQTTDSYEIADLTADVSGVEIGIQHLELYFSPEEFPVATLNEPYSATMTVTNGVAPYTFNGQTTAYWPAPGLEWSFDEITGALSLSGTPTVLGVSGGDWSVTDSKGVEGWPNLGIFVKTNATNYGLTSSANPVDSGIAVTFTFTVTGIEGYTPDGIVTFYDDDAVITGCEEVHVEFTGGIAACSDVALADGLHKITAEYMGDQYYFDKTLTLNQQVGALPTYSISGAEFNDVDDDGLYDTGDLELTYPIELDQGCDGSVDDTRYVVDTGGNYSFTNLAADQEYCLNIQAIPPAWKPTTTVHITSLNADVVDQNLGIHEVQVGINPDALPKATFGELYSQVITITGADGPYTWSEGSNDLPAGIGYVFDGNAGTITISGTSTIVGYGPLVGTITSAHGASLSIDLGLEVWTTPELIFTASPNPSALGEAVTFTLDGVGFSPEIPVAGLVAFTYDGGTPIAGCEAVWLNYEPDYTTYIDQPAVCTTTALPVGTHEITASFGESKTPYYDAIKTLTHVVNPPFPADLSLTNTDSKDPIKPGASLVYTLTVKNLGPNIAESMVLSDKLDSNTNFVSVSAPKGWTCKYASNSGTVTCTAPSLASGSSAVVKITVTVSKTAKVGKELVNNATVSSATYDPILTNNTVVQKTMVAK